MPKDFIPYGRQHILDNDIQSVTDALQSDFLTQGPTIEKFETAYAKRHGAKYACAVTSATAALHLAYQALGLGQGDIFWTCTNTFVATSNAALYLGATVDFVDQDAHTFCMCADALEQKLIQAKVKNKLPKIIVPVHLGGLSADMKSIKKLSDEYGFKIVEDASHCVGADYGGQPVGACPYSDMAVFSFHPVKIITTGEGGMVTTNDQKLYDHVMMARTHGITKDPAKMLNDNPDPWTLEMHFLGFNYRMTDIQAALGLSQLSRLDDNITRRRQLAKQYRAGLVGLPITCQSEIDNGESSYHLFPILFRNSAERRRAFDYLRERNIGTQIHYIPVHTQPYYQGLGFPMEYCPNAEGYYARVLSVPMHHSLSDDDQAEIIQAIKDFFNEQ
jgi:UDP-4-amino-4,6-dideoxy-N-acetyl-beta-L-altrosamine transaminase